MRRTPNKLSKKAYALLLKKARRLYACEAAMQWLEEKQRTVAALRRRRSWYLWALGNRLVHGGTARVVNAQASPCKQRACRICARYHYYVNGEWSYRDRYEAAIKKEKKR